MELRNRFMRSATTSAWSDERSVVRPEIIRLYRELAKGGVGLIVKGHLHVSEIGKGHIGMAGIFNDFHIPKLKELTDGVHEHGGTIVAQLNHAGINSLVDRAGPSEYRGRGWTARALTVDEIGGVVDAFSKAAGRAMEAGFDGVQIHGAHGYLVSQFLSPHVNRRDDDYGGDLKGRTKLLNEVYDSIRARVGDSTPVLLKLNCDDFSPGGLTVEESAVVAGSICKRGLDSIEISGGGVNRKQELRARARSDDPELAEADFAGHAEKIRKSTKPTPMALVHGIRSLRCMEALLDNDLADLVSMSRPFLREPDLVKKLESGQQNVSCTTCDLCHAQDNFSKKMIRCFAES
jgi:2,4-dienoyl-CoA reductase-like NADH-dependent reductase (Old Yellow Enzyme family)